MSARIPSGDCAVSPPASWNRVPLRQLQQAADELVHPLLRQLWRKRQRKECGPRCPAHGGNVAESAGQAAVPDRVRRMPLAAEVNVLQAEVGGDQYFVPARHRSARRSRRRFPHPGSDCRPRRRGECAQSAAFPSGARAASRNGGTSIEFSWSDCRLRSFRRQLLLAGLRRANHRQYL